MRRGKGFSGKLARNDAGNYPEITLHVFPNRVADDWRYLRGA